MLFYLVCLWLCSFTKRISKIIFFSIFFFYPIICQFCQTISSCFDCFALALLTKQFLPIFDKNTNLHFFSSNNLFLRQVLNTFLILLWNYCRTHFLVWFVLNLTYFNFDIELNSWFFSFINWIDFVNTFLNSLFEFIDSIYFFFLFIHCWIHQLFFGLIQFILFNPNLPDPVNFVPFGMMTYSPFDINLMSITCIKIVYLYFCLFLNKA